MSNVVKGKPTQISIIKQHLLNGEEITPLGAYGLCHTIRLSAIIYELRYSHGMNIVNLGKPKSHAIYKLVEEVA